jgi:putative chitinase
MTVLNKAAFYAAFRTRLGPLSASQVRGTEHLLNATHGLPLAHQAYMLATAWHETAGTMLPIKERGGNAYFTKMYDVGGDRPKTCIAYGNTCAGDGPKHCGRGFVQLTWKVNYDKADAALAKAGLIIRGDLLANPDLAMLPDLAAYIMVEGMRDGWFTGKKLSTYLPDQGVATRLQYMAARKIINGTDRDDLVEDYAQVFERALRDGGVR